MSVYIDLTEFLNNPMLSGIQRVTAQLCHHWPGSDLKPVRLTRVGHLTELDGSLIKAIGESFECQDGSAKSAILPFQDFEGPPLRLQSGDTVLVPELFFDPHRVSYYKNLDAAELNHHRFIIYDLTPIAHPEFFPDEPMDVICGYFQMVRRFPHCGFISEATQQAFCGRLLRSSRLTGSVLRLGSDGLGPRPQNVGFQRPLRFTVVGRLVPYKNPALVLEAFEPLLSQIPGLRLTFLGKTSNIEKELAQKIVRMSLNPLSGLEYLSEPDDDQLRKCIDESRATIFVSVAEGFGLPPVESLWRGTPVIISRGIPSVETIGSTGLHLVDPLSVESLRKAVLAFLDNSYFKQKVDEALSLDLPTWRSFAAEVAQWCRPQVCSKAPMVRDEGAHSTDVQAMCAWWNESAKNNEMSAILSNRVDWDEAEFFSSGHEWLRQHFEWAAGAGFKPGGRSALDFGCGVGRMTNALATQYESVVGIDISDEMLRLAGSLSKAPNIRFSQVFGATIPEQNRSFDLVYSTIVIQHIAPPFNLQSVADMFRLCKGGGYVLFDAPSHKLRSTDPEPGHGIFLMPLESILRLAHSEGLELLALRNFPATSTRHFQYLFQRLD